ncbi:uncharacterized protein BDZ83DRAFT_623860 [Colletotrichum acutatum]|uniref:Azaphilone pigments biosynthesis cluster protein L N-terminal domain-containing protein n=1 Tax=Glomerella acutata TaxID=27357 RepID=A0AAD8XDX5_GLOAC|nr:uncharacterized protein BDZ83DRAFT_623860 [Colletotrichum acutatum]KAK1724199.1 hypothetical protein BDZ83DRAFT_623860 [Colletotrichum acutatum]
MDPLSVTASIITLIEASGILTKSLHGFIHGLKTVDARVTRLCEELKNLTNLLEAVEGALKDCRSYDLAKVEEDLLQQSDIALADCQATLNDLKMLIEKVKKAAGSRALGWKIKAMFDLSIHGNELVAFQEKIHKSNGALQTIFHTITVSLSLKSKMSHTLIMDELFRLRQSIDRAHEISAKPSEVFTHSFSRLSDARLSRNLKALAKAADGFYSTASSSAGTSRGDRSERTWKPSSSAGFSGPGHLSSFRRERIERFIIEGQTRNGSMTPQLLPQVNTSFHSQSPPETCFSAVKSNPPAPGDDDDLKSLEVVAGGDDKAEEEDDDADDEAAFSREYILCIRQIAIESIKARDFTKAGDLLEKALARCEKATADNGEYCQSSYISMRSLKVQLAICYFFQGNWKLAEPVVTGLASSKSSRDSVVCNLLHALALAYLSEYSFDIALDTCKQALRGHARLSKLRKTDVIMQDLNNSLGLLATTYDMTSDYLSAEVFRRRLSPGFKYQHPANVAEFLQNHSDFLTAALGPYTLDPACVVLPDSPIGQPSEQDATTSSPSEQEVSQVRWDGWGTINHLPSNLRLNMANHRRLEVDTSKIVVARSRSCTIEGHTVEESSPTETILTSPATTASSPNTSPESSPVRGRIARSFSAMGLNRSIARAEPGFGTVSELSLPCDSRRQSTRDTRQPLRSNQETWSVIETDHPTTLPVARHIERWKWIRGWRIPQSDGVLDERTRPAKLQRRSATRVPGRSLTVGEWFTPAKWFRTGQTVLRQASSYHRVVVAAEPRRMPAGPGFPELNGNAVSELGITSPTPELGHYLPSPVSATPQRVHFYVPQAQDRLDITAHMEVCELPSDISMSGALTSLEANTRQTRSQMSLDQFNT